MKNNLELSSNKVSYPWRDANAPREPKFYPVFRVFSADFRSNEERYIERMIKRDRELGWTW